MPNPSASQAILDALAASLQAQITPILQDVINDFPDANRNLRFPSASLFSNAPSYRPEGTPYTINAPDPGDDLGGNPALSVKYVVGHRTWNMQVDFWCRDKEQRYEIIESVEKLFSSQLPVMGLSLVLSGYHNEVCHYTLNGYSLDDTEESSQKREWRLRVNLLADARAVQQYDQSAILESEIQLEVSTSTLEE
ncbi:hypothetical protein KAR91_01505 [Candidatus Pacearchaeota archaeon]|nr:hypothetical protein [Candidatus Pacearchaeota archaeon]